MTAPATPLPGRLERIVRALAHALLAHPRSAVALALVTLAVTGYAAAGLPLDGSFAALLPDDDPAVLETDRMMREVGGSGDMIVALAGEQRLSLARTLVARLAAEPFIEHAAVDYPVGFFLDRRLLLMPSSDLAHLRDSVHSAVERARAQASPLFVDLEDEVPAADRWKPFDDAERSALADLPPENRVTRDGKWLLVHVRPRGGFSDMDAGADVLARIEADVAALAPSTHGVEVRYAGALPMNQEQNTWMNQDLRGAAGISLGLVALIVILAFRRLSAPLVLGLPLLLGIASTLALTRLGFGRLNLVAGFLVSTLFGLGIDFGLHLYLRFGEYLAEGTERRAAMADAMFDTLRGSNTAALTTIVAFLAVASSSFRGFREFGLVAAGGIMLTLVATYLVLPPLAILVVRRAPPRKAPGRDRNLSRTVAWSVVGVSLVATAIAAATAGTPRWQGDFDALRGTSQLVEFSHRIEVEEGGVLAPALLRVPTLAAAKTLGGYLDGLAADASSGVRRQLSLASLLPVASERALPLLSDMATDLASLDTTHLDPVDRSHVEEARRLVTARPWTLAELPATVRTALATTSGEGALIAVWPRSFMATDREVMAWTDTLQRIRHAADGMGIKVEILDENVLAATVLAIARAEVPRVVVVAALAVFLVLLLDFRRAVPVLMVAGSLALGILWMVALMRLLDIELNVFNQAVLPTIIGMGLDNAIHIEHRYAALGRGSLRRLLRTTGFASLLAALTTAVGFGSTLWARHAGVRSMGELAVAGFACTFFTGSVLLPFLRRVMEGQRAHALSAAAPPNPHARS